MDHADDNLKGKFTALGAYIKKPFQVNNSIIYLEALEEARTQQIPNQ